MKKIITITAIAASITAFAAFDVVSNLQRVPVTAPTAISAGATNTTIVSASNLRGRAGVYVCAAPALDRILDVTVYVTNYAAGGWSVYAHGTAATNAEVYALGFTGEYITNPIRVDIGAVGANTTASAFILSE